MKAIILAATLFAGLALAAPAPAANPVPSAEKRAFQVSITFHSPDGTSFSQLFPADNSVHDVSNQVKTISSISSPGGGFCTFRGADGSSTVVYSEADEPVNPPQPQLSGSCDNA